MKNWFRQMGIQGRIAAALAAYALMAPAVRAAADDASAKRQQLTADIASTSQAISQGESQLTDLNNKLVGANLILVTATVAYNKQGLTDGQRLVAGLAVVAAQGVVDDLNAQKSRVESDLKYNRDRLNQLRGELLRLGSP